MSKFLDSTGLSTVLNKIKSYINSKIPTDAYINNTNILNSDANIFGLGVYAGDNLVQNNGYGICIDGTPSISFDCFGDDDTYNTSEDRSNKLEFKSSTSCLNIGVCTDGTNPYLDFQINNATSSMNGLLTSKYYSALETAYSKIFCSGAPSINIKTTSTLNLLYPTFSLDSSKTPALSTVTLPAVTTSAAGLMTSTDKTKLNSIDVPTQYAWTSGSNVYCNKLYDYISFKSTSSSTITVGIAFNTATCDYTGKTIVLHNISTSTGIKIYNRYNGSSVKDMTFSIMTDTISSGVYSFGRTTTSYIVLSAGASLLIHCIPSTSTSGAIECCVMKVI